MTEESNDKVVAALEHLAATADGQAAEYRKIIERLHPQEPKPPEADPEHTTTPPPPTPAEAAAANAEEFLQELKDKNEAGWSSSPSLLDR